MIHNGIPFKHIDINPIANHEHQKITFLLVGRIKPEKGQWFVVETLSEMNKEILQKTKFIFVGSTLHGKEYLLQELKTLIKNNDLDEYIEFVPFCKEIEFYYDQADICLVPSQFNDPFPTTVLEAMSFKKPVIGTNLGGIPEMINSGKTGIIVKSESKEELRKAITFFVDNQDQIYAYGNAGFRQFVSNFTIKSFHNRFEEVFK